VTKLKVVTDGDVAPAPTNLKEAVESTERAVLVMIRAKIADELDSGVPPHTLAPLTRQLRDIDREIRALDVRELEEADANDVAPDEDFDTEAL
jgi:hypothetical protein